MNPLLATGLLGLGRDLLGSLSRSQPARTPSVSFESLLQRMESVRSAKAADRADELQRLREEFRNLPEVHEFLSRFPLGSEASIEAAADGNIRIRLGDYELELPPGSPGHSLATQWMNLAGVGDGPSGVRRWSLN